MQKIPFDRSNPKKVLLLFWKTKFSDDRLDFSYAPQYGCDYECYFRLGDFLLAHILRKLWYRLGLPKLKWWYNPRLKGYAGTMVCFDAMADQALLHWLKANNPEARMIFWYWNPVHPKKIQPSQVKAEGFEVWSYSEKDCKTYGMHHNTTFVIPEWYAGISISKSPFFDIAFIGKDKGRLAVIN